MSKYCDKLRGRLHMILKEVDASRPRRPGNGCRPSMLHVPAD